MKSPSLLILMILALATLALADGTDMKEKTILIDFNNPDRQWLSVNDGVMGGLSRSDMFITDQGTAIFSGQLSLENNGGFASVRTNLSRQDYSGYSGVELRIKGDGQNYQLRFRTDGRADGAAYRAIFPTQAGLWTTVRLAFEDFQPTYRGRVLKGYPGLNTASLRQLTFLLADKKAGPFQLEIESIDLVLDSP